MGERGEGGIGAEAIGGARKKKKGEAEEGGDAKDAVEEDGEGGTGFLLREPAKKIEESDGVSASGADEEEVKKEADEGEMDSAEVGKMDFLKAKNKIEASGTKQDGKESDEKGSGEPVGLGGGEAVGEVGPVDFTRKKAEDAGGDAEADPRGKPV